ncbi:cysteine hydrolase [bacterium]|nr:cysteine hydrolase [bacterium]
MNTALLIIDIQNDYFLGGAMELVGALKAAENAQQIIERFRSTGQPLVFIQHIARESQAAFFLADTDGVKIHENVQPAPDETVIVKHYPNSFRETRLLDFLKENEIMDLVICGMMTHMCVDTTTRAAADLGFNCTLIGDACATLDLEYNNRTVASQDVQTAYLSALNGTLARVLTTQEYLHKS